MLDLPCKLIPGWLNTLESEEWNLKLYKNLDWGQPEIKVYGKNFLVPRKTVFLGEKDISYTYSNFVHYSKLWPDWFYPLLEKVCFTSKCIFNGCLVNLYRDGRDRMGWHSDNEIELDASKPISSLSLGSSRDFDIKHRYLNKKERINLKNGDLLIMYPPFQSKWLHSIPVRKKIHDYRINLTFRSYLK